MIAASPKPKRGRGVIDWRRGVRMRERETEREGSSEKQSTLPVAFLCLVQAEKGGRSYWAECMQCWPVGKRGWWKREGG